MCGMQKKWFNKFSPTQKKQLRRPVIEEVEISSLDKLQLNCEPAGGGFHPDSCRVKS